MTEFPQDLSTLSHKGLQGLVKELDARDALPKPASKCKKAELIEALESVRPTAAAAGRNRKNEDPETEKAVVKMRNEDRLGWVKIATELGLGGPGVARRIYRNAHGLPRTAPLGRVGKGGRTPTVNAYPDGYSEN